MLIERNPVRARQVKLGPVTASQVCFGTEHINRSVPEFGGNILANAARRRGSSNSIARKSSSPPRPTAAAARRRNTT